MYKLILLLLSLLILSCSDDSDNFEALKDTGITPIEFDGKTFVSSVILDSMSSLRDSSDTTVIEFAVTKGHSYQITVNSVPNHSVMIITHSSGSYLSGSAEHLIVAESTGEEHIRLYHSNRKESDKSVDFHITIREIKPTPLELHGLWLLRKDENRSGEYESNRYYSNTDANMALEFYDDSLRVYRYSEEWGVTIFETIVSKFWLLPKEYCVDDSLFVLFSGNEYGYSRLEFERIEAIDDLSWKKEDYVISDEAQGMWYHSSLEGCYMDFRITSEEMITEQTYYSSAEESNRIISIEGDSIVRASRVLFSVSISKEPITEHFDMLDNSSFSKNSFTYSTVEFDVDWDGQWETYGIEEKYTKYEGVFPPASWYVITPDKPTIKLENGVTYESETFSKRDTVWLEYEFEAGMTYSFSKRSVDCSARAFLIDSDKAYVSELYDWYEAEKSGIHHIAVVVNVDEIEEESGSFEFTLFE